MILESISFRRQLLSTIILREIWLQGNDNILKVHPDRLPTSAYRSYYYSESYIIVLSHKIMVIKQ